MVQILPAFIFASVFLAVAPGAIALPQPVATRQITAFPPIGTKLPGPKFPNPGVGPLNARQGDLGGALGDPAAQNQGGSADNDSQGNGGDLAGGGGDQNGGQLSGGGGDQSGGQLSGGGSDGSQVQNNGGQAKSGGSTGGPAKGNGA